MTNTVNVLRSSEMAQGCITAPSNPAQRQTGDEMRLNPKAMPKTHLRTVSSTQVVRGRKVSSPSQAPTRDVAPPVQMDFAAIMDETVTMDDRDAIAFVEGAYTPYCCGVGLSHINELRNLIDFYAIVKRLPGDSKDSLVDQAKRCALITVPNAIQWFQSEIDRQIEWAMTYPLRDLASRCRDSQYRTLWLGLDVDPNKFYSMRVNPASLPSEEECRALSELYVIVTYRGETTEYSILRELCESLYQAQPTALQVIDLDIGRIAHLILSPLSQKLLPTVVPTNDTV